MTTRKSKKKSSNEFKINIKQSTTYINNLFINIDDNISNIINKYLKYQLSDEIFEFAKNITNKVYYKYITNIDITYFIYELQKYNLNDVLIISPNLHIASSIEYINEHFKNNSIKYNTILLKKYSRASNEIFNNNINKFEKLYNNTNNNILVYDNYITKLEQLDIILPKCKKYNFIILDNINPNNEFYKYKYYSTETINYKNKIYVEVLLVQIYNILNNLNTHGDCIIYCIIPYNDEIKQLLYYISSKFKYYTINKGLYTWYADCFIILKDFQGTSNNDIKLINNLYNKYKKIYPKNINNTSVTDLFKKSIVNILEPDSINKYKIFENKANNIVNNTINVINNMIEEAYYIAEEIKNGNTDIVKYYEQKNIADTIGLAKSIGIELLPRLQEKVFNDEFGKTILANIYSYDNYIWYKFKKHELPKFHFNIKLDTQLEIFDNFVQKFRNAMKIIDTRELKEYQNIKMKVRHYEKTLSKHIETNFTNNHKVSRAFLKSYEIIETFDLINTKGKTFNAFFICEAPGAFILAVNHYIKTQTNIENYNWIAQTLNPKVKFQNEKGFGDDFKLMKNFKNRWDLGPFHTGDATDINNIKYYRKIYRNNNLHLVTGDCGIANIFDSDPTHLADKLHIAQIIIMLSILKKGGNFILKLYLPSIYPVYISLFYLIYTRFNSFQIYKSFQNSWSPEFYIVGKNYQEPINDNEFNKLLYLISKFNINNTIIKLDKIPEAFTEQLNQIIHELLHKFKLAIKRVIYYVDNKNDISKNDMKKLYMSIKNKNEDWSKIFKIKKINKKDLIH